MRVRVSRGKAVVVAVVAAAAGFGILLGYLAWNNDSFPTRAGAFADYATVTGASFNGTEYAFTLSWRSAAFTPLYAQLNSPTSDTANTPVCDLKLSSSAANQTVFMPFGLGGLSTGLTGVDLRIAVQSAANGTQFTITYHVDSVSAAPGDIQPQGLSCSQPAVQE